MHACSKIYQQIVKMRLIYKRNKDIPVVNSADLIAAAEKLGFKFFKCATTPATTAVEKEVPCAMKKWHLLAPSSAHAWITGLVGTSNCPGAHISGCINR